MDACSMSTVSINKLVEKTNSKSQRKCKSSKSKVKKHKKMDLNNSLVLKGRELDKVWKLKVFDAVQGGFDDDIKVWALFLAWGRERFFHLLGVISLLICTILFVVQAYLAFRSYQIMHQLNNKRPMPEMLYNIYFDGHDWAFNLDKVDLRANTTLFIH